MTLLRAATGVCIWRDVIARFDEDAPESAGGTLGDVLYADQSEPLVSESEWVQLVRSIAANDQAALHALYERAHALVFTLALRITRSRETAEEVTLDVFHDVWRRASAYDPANGTVLGWIMNGARSRAIDRVRFDRRKKRQGSISLDADEESLAEDPHDSLITRRRDRALRAALGVLTPEERGAVESAFLSGLTHAEVAALLEQPLGTIKTRIRSALHKLRAAMEGEEP